MPIPDFQTLMLPVLEFYGHGEEKSLRDAVEALALQCSLSEEERNTRIPSGKQPVFYNRVGWARTYLKQAGLLKAGSKRPYLLITERGLNVLKSMPPRIDMKYLEQFPEYIQFKERTGYPGNGGKPPGDGAELTAEESMDQAYGKLRADLGQQLLDSIIASSPEFFENLVVELLVAMGYGGSDANAARAVGKSGDEGIDGIIDEDKLGLDSIYIQAKKWSDQPISRPEIQKFVGALQGKRAKKGIFITASHFTQQARDYAASIEVKVVLIDGKRLAELMIDSGVGVTTATTYAIKKIDSDYFIETLE